MAATPEQMAYLDHLASRGQIDSYNTIASIYGVPGWEPSVAPQSPQAAPMQSSGPNPYLGQMADEISRRSNLGLGQAFNNIRSNAVGVGGLGGSRQGVAQGVATGMANDALSGNLANLYGTDWTNQQNRDLQRYGIDTNRDLQNRSLNVQMRGQDIGWEMGQRGMDQNFYTQQRGQDLQQLGLGANIYNMGVQGGWAPIDAANDVFKSWSGMNQSQTNSGKQGGGWGGAAGGLWGGWQLANTWGK